MVGEGKHDILGIDRNFNHSEIINSILREGENLIKIIYDIHRHFVPKIQYHNLNGRFVPVLNSLGSNENLINYTKSIIYRINTFIVQIELIEETLHGMLIEANKNSYKKFQLNDYNDDNYLTRTNVLLDNLIIYCLTLIEYIVNFTTHICFKRRSYDWKQFYNKVRNNKEYDFLKVKTQKYNKTIKELKDYRNSLIHIQINQKNRKIIHNFINGQTSYKLDYSDRLISTTKKFIFNDNLDYSNNIVLHYSIVREFIKVSQDIAQTLRQNMFDKNGKSRFY